MKCVDKMSFATRREAYEEAKKLRKHGKKNARKIVSVYECPFCGMFHLTHKQAGRYKSRMHPSSRYNYSKVVDYEARGV